MAEHIERDQIVQKIGFANYEDIRDELKSGDLLFASGGYLPSKLIEIFSGSSWSHVGIIFKFCDRILLLESVMEMGVRFAPLSKYMDNYMDEKPYPGYIVIARHNKVNESVVNELAKAGIDRLTCSYDFKDIVEIPAAILTCKEIEPDKGMNYICSEPVHDCFKEADIGLQRNRSGYVTPEDIWTDPNILPRYCILKDNRNPIETEQFHVWNNERLLSELIKAVPLLKPLHTAYKSMCG